MSIKNYTSSVPVERTVARIEQALAAAGVSGTSKEYSEGKLVALTFSLTAPSGQVVQVRLPASESNVYDAMLHECECARVRPMRAAAKMQLKQQAGRTAWKLMQDWVEVQLSLIKMHQADFEQVFMPYIWDGRRTFYMALKEQNFAPLRMLDNGDRDSA
jgi:hypothetical protein